jgi:hypothetical protein
MLTHRAEGSGLEAKTALRGSVLRAISQIYVLFLDEHRTETWIASRLNEEGIAAELGRP